MFALGGEYTRREIHRNLGGSMVSCLPTSNGVIVAACLSKKFSPQAPAVVLCGRGALTSLVSTQFALQQNAIPVFLKNVASRWQYYGEFTVELSVSAGEEFESFITGSDRTVASVSHVVLLKQVR